MAVAVGVAEGVGDGGATVAVGLDADATGVGVLEEPQAVARTPAASTSPAMVGLKAILSMFTSL
jgi:hypothetical protein